MKEAHSSETSVYICQAKRRHVPKYSYLVVGLNRGHPKYEAVVLHFRVMLNPFIDNTKYPCVHCSTTDLKNVRLRFVLVNSPIMLVNV
jgi:hypothetical protein